MKGTFAWLCLAAFSASAAGAPAFTLDSPQIAEGTTIAMAHVYPRCGGENISPQLRWHDPPAGTKSFAVTVFDPDAPGDGFWHWIAFDIAVGAHGLNAGAGTPRSGNAPGDAVQLRNGFGNVGYSGPCPPPGKPHHYVFTVYALDVPALGVSRHADPEAALAAIRKHAIASANITARFGR